MKIQLLSGSYSARGIAASVQRCVNLYPEQNLQEAQAETPVTHYPTPGATRLGAFPDAAPVRALWATSADGTVIAVCGQSVYQVTSAVPLAFRKLGTLGLARSTPVSITDNGRAAILVDGSSIGYQVNFPDYSFAAINPVNNTGPNGYGFGGGTRVDIQDTFLLSNVPQTNRFVASLSNSTVFDALQFASKSGRPDPLQSLAVVMRYLWLIGVFSTEVWQNSGGSGFPFSILPGPFIEHGTISAYSVAVADESVFWLHQDKNGFGIVLEGAGYIARRISNFALEDELSHYALGDAQGMCYQQGGHTFYVLRFPTQDKTWVFDKSTRQWHERVSLDANGNEHSWPFMSAVQGFGLNLVGDAFNGGLFTLDLRNFTDWGWQNTAEGTPVKRLRHLPHIVDELKRIKYSHLVADMQGAGLQSDFDPATDTASPEVLLRASDDRGISWSSYRRAPLGLPGQTRTRLKWTRLGMAPDKVFELSWSAGQFSSLAGAYVEVKEMVS